MTTQPVTDDDRAQVVGFTDDEAPSNYYPNVYDFVSDFLVAMYAHDTNPGSSWKWCPWWFRHTEAMARLEAAWKAWEVLRRDPGTGASAWFRDHGDPAMTILTSADGPFRGCSTEGHKPQPALPIELPPPALLET